MSVTSATWVSDTSIKVVVTVDPEAAVGPTTLEVLNEGSGMGLLSGGAARCAGCLTIS